MSKYKRWIKNDAYRQQTGLVFTQKCKTQKAVVLELEIIPNLPIWTLGQMTGINVSTKIVRAPHCGVHNNAFVDHSSFLVALAFSVI